MPAMREAESLLPQVPALPDLSPGAGAPGWAPRSGKGELV